MRPQSKYKDSVLCINSNFYVSANGKGYISNSGYASSAGYAASAGYASSAGHANSAGNADKAKHADSAGVAEDLTDELWTKIGILIGLK